jgi:hypothetical protein
MNVERLSVGTTKIKELIRDPQDFFFFGLGTLGAGEKTILCEGYP